MSSLVWLYEVMTAQGMTESVFCDASSGLDMLRAPVHRKTHSDSFFCLFCSIPGVQGTTTNGEYLLPFKTGAFLAGAPVQPVILKYGKVPTLTLPELT